MLDMFVISYSRWKFVTSEQRKLRLGEALPKKLNNAGEHKKVHVVVKLGGSEPSR